MWLKIVEKEKKMATEISKLKKRRTTRRNTVTRKLLSNINEIIEKPSEEKIRVEVIALLETLEEEDNKIKKLDDEIFDMIENEEELEKESDDVVNISLKIKMGKEKLRKCLSGFNEDTSTTSSHKSKGVKLPKFYLKSFEGNPMEWKPFIEAYEASIDNKEELSSVEKFTYLKGYLKGTALNTIEGFPLTNENYATALELLKKRYGNSQLIISSHMNDLIKIEKVKNGNILDLRNMYDKIEANVRALNSEGIDPSHFGPMLIPIILEKLPNSIQLHISRKLGKDNWNIEEFLKCVNEEITARENCDLLKLHEVEESPRNNSYTASSLFTKGKEISCVFCGGKGHYSDKCQIVTDVSSRVEKLKEMRCCFNCLRPSHRKKDCRKNIKCYTCKGNHHTALCFKENEKHSLVNINEDHVLLQTATGFITDVKEKQEVEIRIVFDSCSQQTYITEEIAKKNWI